MGPQPASEHALEPDLDPQLAEKPLVETEKKKEEAGLRHLIRKMPVRVYIIWGWKHTCCHTSL